MFDVHNMSINDVILLAALSLALVAWMIWSLWPGNLLPKDETNSGVESDEERLAYALYILGVNNDTPKHVRHVLVLQIAQFAGVNGDLELESQCEIMLKTIESE